MAEWTHDYLIFGDFIERFYFMLIDPLKCYTLGL